MLGHQALECCAVELGAGVRRSGGAVRTKHAGVKKIKLGMSCEFALGAPGENLNPE